MLLTQLLLLLLYLVLLAFLHLAVGPLLLLEQLLGHHLGLLLLLEQGSLFALFLSLLLQQQCLLLALLLSKALILLALDLVLDGKLRHLLVVLQGLLDGPVVTEVGLANHGVGVNASHVAPVDGNWHRYLVVEAAVGELESVDLVGGVVPRVDVGLWHEVLALLVDDVLERALGS